MKRATRFAITLALICASPLAAVAQQPATQQRDSMKSSEGKLPAGDQKFITKVAQDGKAEVELGRLASEKGSAPSVKQFGERMATDHAKAGEELAQLAQQKGVSLPAEMDSAHKNLHARLSKLSGAAFDREYAQAMVRDHDKDVKEFDRHAKTAKDGDVKAFATKTLPVLREHQQQAHQLEASVKTASGGDAKPAR